MKNIVNLTKENYSEIFKLSEYAFQYHLNEEAYNKKCAEADRHKIYGYKIDDKLAGKLHMIPLEVFIQDKLFTMGGISSVATWPEYSGQKIAEKLIKKSLVEFKEKNTQLAYLHPFNVGFYRRFGFEIAFDSVNYKIPVEKLRHPWKKTGTVHRDNIKISELNLVYEQFANQFNGGIKRDEKWWQQRVLTDEQAAVILIKSEDGEPEGYLIYRVENKCFEVIEIAYSNQTYLESIYHFILKHQATIKDVKISTHEGDLLSYLINDPMFTQEKQPYFMARIVELESFLRNYPFMIAEEASINLYVKDDFLTDNTAFYTISSHGIIKREKLEKGDFLEINIGDLTSLLIGYKNLMELRKLNKITGNQNELDKLYKMLNPKPTYLLDYF